MAQADPCSSSATRSTVISAFAIIILSVLGGLYRGNHHEFVGGKEDPQPSETPEVAATIFIAVLVYAVSRSVWRRRRGGAEQPADKPTQGFLVFCGLQGMLHVRESRRGAIAL